MKFNSCLSFLIYFFTISLGAQNTYFDISESEKFRDSYRANEVITVHVTHYNETFVVRTSAKKLVFEVYDKGLNNILNTAIDISKKENVISSLLFNDELKIFTVYSPSKTERIINCHIFNIKEKKHRLVTIFKTTVEKNQGLFSGQNKRQTNFSISPDEKYLAIATDDIKKNSNSYLIHVFDAHSLELQYSKNYYSSPEKHYNASDMIVDDSGRVFNLGKEFISGKKEKDEDKANYVFVMNMISQDDVASSKMQMEENELIESLTIINKGGELDLIGFSSEKREGRINGISKITINSDDLSIINKTRVKLPVEVYEDLYGNKRADRKKNKELSSFYLDHIVEDELGNTYLLAEEFFVTYNYVYNGTTMGGFTQTTYHYNDILIIKLDHEGNLDWGRSIFKRAGAPSYNAFVENNKLHVLLNSGKNLKEKEDGRTKVSKGWLESSSLYDFVFDNKGKIEIEKIQDNKGNTVYIPYLGAYNNGRFIMFNRSKSERQLMLLETK